MSLEDIKRLGAQLGISFAGLEEQRSALFTRLMQHASGVEESDEDDTAEEAPPVKKSRKKKV